MHKLHSIVRQIMATPLSRSQKVALGLIGIAIVLVYTFMPKMGLLYGDLKLKDRKAILSQLKDWDVSFDLRNRGKEIYVTEEDVRVLRISLAENSLPQSGSVGIDFPLRRMGQSTQTASTLHALEDELSRTIETIETVRSANIQLELRQVLISPANPAPPSPPTNPPSKTAQRNQPPAPPTKTGDEITEMETLVAYLKMLGTLVDTTNDKTQPQESKSAPKHTDEAFATAEKQQKAILNELSAIRKKNAQNTSATSPTRDRPLVDPDIQQRMAAVHAALRETIKVSLEMQQNKRPNGREINAIEHLVSAVMGSVVPDLGDYTITISDNLGELSNQDHKSSRGSTYLFNNQLALQRSYAYERAIEQEILRSASLQFSGSKYVRAEVKATMDFSTAPYRAPYDERTAFAEAMMQLPRIREEAMRARQTWAQDAGIPLNKNTTLKIGVGIRSPHSEDEFVEQLAVKVWIDGVKNDQPDETEITRSATDEELEMIERNVKRIVNFDEIRGDELRVIDAYSQD